MRTDFDSKSLSRNDPCWCGSGKKYKKCHWSKDRTAPPSPAKWDAPRKSRKIILKNMNWMRQISNNSKPKKEV